MLNSNFGLIAFVLRGIKWIWGLFVSPNIRVLDSEISSNEPTEKLVLWQIPVENKQRTFPLVCSAKKCTVDLQFFRCGGPILKVEGRWTSDDGPIEHKDLAPDGRIHFVPIVIQAFEPGFFSPGTLRHTIITLEPGIVHVLGKDSLIGGNNSQRIDIGDYELKVSVKGDGKELTARKYTLHVPRTGHAVLKMVS